MSVSHLFIAMQVIHIIVYNNWTAFAVMEIDQTKRKNSFCSTLRAFHVLGKECVNGDTFCFEWMSQV